MPSVGQVWWRHDNIGATVGEAVVVRIIGDWLRLRITKALCHDEQMGVHFQCTIARLRNAGYSPTSIVLASA